MSFLKRLFGSKPATLDDVLGPVNSNAPVTAKPPLSARSTADVLRTFNWSNTAALEAPAPDAIDLSETRSQTPLAAQPMRAALRGLNWDNRAALTNGPVAPPASNSKPTAAPGHPAHTVDDVLNQFAWD